jgi:pimeloyl-ACP methyl ester carboxylesterase
MSAMMSAPRNVAPASRAVAALAAIALCLTACADASTQLSSRAKAVQSSDTSVAFKDCGSNCTGEIDGAKYSIVLPAKWNGTLLLYSHGYRFATPAPPNNEPVDTNAQVSSTDTDGSGSDSLSKALLADGYALAGSSYKSNGWAVADGVKAGEDLRAKFLSVVGTPKRTYVWGDSLGGLITELLSEKHPEWVDGAAPMCGAVAGPNMNFDLALDVAYAVKVLIDPALKLTGYASAQDAADNFDVASAAVQKAAADVSGGGTAKVLTIAAIADAPTQTAKFDGDDLTSQVSARVESILTALAFGTSGRYEIEQRVGGNPSTNVDAKYATRISATEATLIKAAGGNPDALADELENGQRIAADADARAKFTALGDTTGKISVPTVTMHTEADPLVIVQNETVFAQRVIGQNRPADLAQFFIRAPAKYSQDAGAPYGAGHCNFSDQQREGLLSVLDTWVRGGGYPNVAGVAPSFGAGFDGTYVNQAWPAPTSS